jgi:hypothetical protein
VTVDFLKNEQQESATMMEDGAADVFDIYKTTLKLPLIFA